MESSSCLFHFCKHSLFLSVQKPNNLTSANNLVILPELESWAWYCVRVQSKDDYYKKTSAFSPTYCIQTDGKIS